MSSVRAAVGAARDRFPLGLVLARRVGGPLVAVGGPILLTAVLHRWGQPGRVAEYTFLYLAVVVVAGGLYGAIAAAVGSLASALLVDWFFLPPIKSLTLYTTEELVNWAIFLAVCLAVGQIATALRRHYRRAREAVGELEAANRELVRAQRAQLEADRTARELAVTAAELAAARKAERFKRELLATISHELRTPLGSLMGFSNALLQEDALDAPTRHDYLQLIASESRRLGRLVNDLLELSRIESGQLHVECEPVDLVEAAVEAGQRWSTQLDVIVADSGCRSVLVLADWDRLQQVLDNLLRNVVEHVGAHTGATVRLSLPDAEHACCEIEDGGPGIDAALLPHLFDGRPRSPRAGSPGLGLAISKGLVDAMGGAMWARNRDGGGASFGLLLMRSAA